MNYLNLKNRIAENLNILDADESTIINGRVTSTSLANRINQIYREELFPLVSSRYPHDFEQETYPIDTYTATGTVDEASTSTTLVATTGIFNNSMEGFKVYNATDGETREITSYSSTTTVTVDSAIDDDWDGDTIYVLGNEFTLGGSLTDLKEVVQVQIKYSSSDQDWYTASRMNKKDASVIDEGSYSITSPVFYLTTNDVGGTPTPAIGILPYPTNYNGKLKVLYIEKPPELTNNTDIPLLENIGISEVIINGVTAWGFRLMQNYKDADMYQALYYDGIYGKQMQYGIREGGLLNTYRPKFRSGKSAFKTNSYIANLRNRSV